MTERKETAMLKDYRIVFLKPRTAALIGGEFDEAVGAGEIFGRNVLSMISTGSERGGFTSEYDASVYPMQTGYSSVAQVVSVGEGVTGYKPGDLFYHNGYHTLYVKVKEEDVIALPEGIMPEKALFGRFAAVSMTSMLHSQAKPVDNVVVTGLGIVGLTGAQMLQNFGYRVYGIDPSKDRREIAKRAGILQVAECVDAWPKIKGDVATLYECSGNEKALRAVIPYIRKGGEAFLVGVPWVKTSDWDAHALLYDIFYGFIKVQSGFEWSISRKGDEFHPHSNYSHIRMAMELIADGRVKIVEDMYELHDPRDCTQVYQEILGSGMKTTSILFDWRNFQGE